MKIGIDMDGVVFDTESIYRATGDLFNYTHGRRTIPNTNEPRVQKRFDWSEDEIQEFMDKYLLSAHEVAPVFPMAKEVLKFLREQEHELIVITNRGNADEREIEITHRRCAAEGLVFDKMYFKQSNKVDVCIAENIDVMLEDYYLNIDAISAAGIPCLYFRDSLLKFCDKPNVIDVNNWGQVPYALDKFFGDKWKNR